MSKIIKNLDTIKREPINFVADQCQWRRNVWVLFVAACFEWVLFVSFNS